MAFNPDYAKEYLERLKRSLPTRCGWCKREKSLNRKQLCNSCNGVRLELDKLQKRAETQGKVGSLELLSPLVRELKICEYMKEDCIDWGERFESILDSPFDFIELEHYFRDFAERVASDGHMYIKLENTLEDLLTSDQAQVLAYLFWQPRSEEASRRRRQGATVRFDSESLRTG